MNALKEVFRKELLESNRERFSKAATMLDPSDEDEQLRRAVAWLDQAMFAPRSAVVEAKDMMTYKGGTFVDVTALRIDVVNAVYYQENLADQTNELLPDVGIMPFLLGGSSFTSLSSVAKYLKLKTNLNLMNRQLNMDGDFELWPMDSEGRRLLQLRNMKPTRIEFLPSLDPEAESWWLYAYEERALKDVLFDMCHLFNAELVMSATPLGTGKEGKELADYWGKKLEADKKEFSDKALVTALF